MFSSSIISLKLTFLFFFMVISFVSDQRRTSLLFCCRVSHVAQRWPWTHFFSLTECLPGEDCNHQAADDWRVWPQHQGNLDPRLIRRLLQSALKGSLSRRYRSFSPLLSKCTHSEGNQWPFSCPQLFCACVNSFNLSLRAERSIKSLLWYQKSQKNKKVHGPFRKCLQTFCFTSPALLQKWFCLFPAELSGLLFIGDGILQVRRSNHINVCLPILLPPRVQYL